MKKNKITLILFIVIELMITIFTIIGKNYVAATGWGFLMLTNAGLLLEQIEKEKQNNGNSN